MCKQTVKKALEIIPNHLKCLNDISFEQPLGKEKAFVEGCFV